MQRHAPPDAAYLPRDAAAGVVEECKATQRAEGVRPVGFGVWLARDAAFERLAWDGLALIEGWWSAGCFSLLTSPDIVCHARQEVCAAVFGMCQRLGGQVKRKSQEGNDNSCAVCAPFSGG